MKKTNVIFISIFIQQVVGYFYWGSVPFSENEMSELNGHMTARQAVMKCETNLECAGFTYHGTFLELDRLKHNIYFFRFLPGIYQKEANLFDWSTYLVDREFAIYDNQVFEGVGRNRYRQFEAGPIYLTKKAEEFCRSDPECSAIAVSKDGQIRVYSLVDLRSLVQDPNWTTLFNLRSNYSNVRGVIDLEEVDYCCPLRIPYFSIDPIDNQIVDSIVRIPCNTTRDEFVKNFVRTKTPVIIEGCKYPEFDHLDLSVESVSKMFHDNKSTPIKKMLYTPKSGFTHTYTPNDFKIEDDEIMQLIKVKDIRTFDRIKLNDDCDKREGSQCRLFQNFRKPEMIPDDLYEITQYNHEYGWIITSNEATGSHPHVDPDLTGAWNYLFKGYKYWVIFTEGVAMRHVECEECFSEHGDESQHTWRWFMHILPQLRNKKFFGKRLQEGIQKPGEAIFLPHGLTHSVLNLKDNVAITENHLFVEGLPELVKMIALDEISIWRQNWDYNAWKKIYYGGYANKEDRLRMRATYAQVVKKLERNPQVCDELEEIRLERWKDKYLKKDSKTERMAYG